MKLTEPEAVLRMAGIYRPQGKGKLRDSIEITLPIPPRATHPNARAHWAVKMKAAKKQRRDAGLAARAALGLARPPLWQRATIQATLYNASTRAKAQDADNLTAWLKASQDGLQDAGIVLNDAGLIQLPPKQVLGREAGTSRLVLVVTPISST